MEFCKLIVKSYGFLWQFLKSLECQQQSCKVNFIFELHVHYRLCTCESLVWGFRSHRKKMGFQLMLKPDNIYPTKPLSPSIGRVAQCHYIDQSELLPFSVILCWLVQVVTLLSGSTLEKTL